MSLLPALALAGLISTGGPAFAASPTITNPSFEADTYTVFPGYHDQAGNGPITGWTPSGGAGLNPAMGSPFADNGVVPDGSQVAFIQSGPSASMSTVIAGLTAGETYKVAFRVNARSGNTPNLKIEIDGGNIINTGITPVGGANPYKYFAFDFTASSASHTMTLRNDAGGDNTVVFDDFRIEKRNSGWSYAAWNDDASSGVNPSKTYTHAYSFGSAAGTVINGVPFTGVAGGNPSVLNKFSTAGLPNVFNNDANNLGGGSRGLANDFLYNGTVQSITLTGLELGAEYVATIYSVGWEDGTRAATFSVGNDRLTVNQDHFGNNNGIAISYRYIATDVSVTLTFVPLQGNTIHVYGFSNYELNPPRPPEIVNPSFEADTFSVFPGYVSGNGPITGWTALGGHGVNPGTFGGPFTDNGVIPDGSKAAFLQADGALRQTVSGFIVGSTYQIRYFENARNCCNGTSPFLEVQVGGNTVVPAHVSPPVGAANPWREVISRPFVADAPSLEIAFIKSNPQGGDTTLLIDNVSIISPGTPPTITVQPQDRIVGLGSTATFSVAAIGSAPLDYQWYFGNDLIPGAFESTLNVAADFPDVAGNYYVVVANSAGSVTSRVAKLTVRAKVPGLFDTGVDATGAALADGAIDPHYTLVINADSASTDAIVQNSAAFPIVAGPWLANTPTSKWIGPRFDTAAAAGLASGNGIYVYRISFDLTGLDRNSVVITGGWAVDNGGLSIRVNGQATGAVNNNGFGGATPFTLNSQNAAFVDGINTLDFEVQNVDALAGYTGLRVVNLVGLAELPGTPPSIQAQPQSQLAGTGESFTLSVAASGSSPLSYQWRKNGADIPGANSATLAFPNVTRNDAGAYSVRISNPAGFIVSGDATIVVRDSVRTVFNTGVDDSRNALPDGAADPHYQLIVNPDSASSTAIVEDSTVFPIVSGPWVANNAGSKWIGPRLETSAAAGAPDAGGDYVYRTIVDLTGFDPAGVVITGEWSTDNEGIDILINGLSTGQRNTGQFVTFTPFVITNGFVAGPNTIDFKLNNSAVGYTGLRVDRIRALGTALPDGTPPFIVTQPQTVTVDPPATVRFSVAANGSAPLQYQWYFGADELFDETNATLQVRFEFPDQVGEYSVRVSNPFGTVTSQVARLQVPIINQAPSFTKGADITVPASAGPAAYIFPNWATDIRSGPSGEPAQGLTFLVTSDNPALFGTQPAIDPANGNLSLAVGSATGVANVTVVLKDDGGTANGGVDQSAPQTFVIRVIPANKCPVAGPSFAVETLSGEPKAITLTGTDEDNDPLTFSITTPPAHGTLSGTPPNLIYTSATGYIGSDSFAYVVSDGRCDSQPAQVNIVVRESNRPPTAKISLDQLVDFTPDYDNPVLISCNWWNSCLRLDGTLSSDPEGGKLTYLWFVEPNPAPVAAGPVATNCLELGTHTIVLAVTDPTGLSDTDTKTIEVVTAPLAVELLMEKVNESSIPRKTKRELLATLRVALKQSGQNKLRLTQATLSAFEKKVRAQVAPGYPAAATTWIRWSQSISQGMENCIKPPPKPKHTGGKDGGGGGEEPN